MEQLLGPDFIANESLLRGLVTFAARKGPTLDNSWPDPATGSEPAQSWTAAPAVRKPGFVPGPALAVFATAQAALATWSAQNDRAPAASAPETVPRAVYEQLSAEKQELQKKLFALLEERNNSDKVPRELFDQVQAEKRQPQEKMC